MQQRLQAASPENGNHLHRESTLFSSAQIVDASDEPGISPVPISTDVGVTHRAASQTSELFTPRIIDSATSPKSQIDRATATRVEEEEFQSQSNSPEAAGYFGPSSTFNFVAKVLPEKSQRTDVGEGEHHWPTPSSTVQEPPVPSDEIISRLSSYAGTKQRDIPERDLADRLLDAYFNYVHPLYPFIHESTFRDQYDGLWHASSPEPHPEWFAILNMVFANGCEFCESVDRDHILPMASVFVSRSRALLAPRLYQPGSLARVQALLLLCHYLQGTLELCECWNLVGVMIRTAVSIGIHLHVADSPAKDAVRKEMEKRVWCGCYIIDRTLSMKFGRPPSIQVLDVQDIPLPLEVDDRYISTGTLVPRQPRGRPSVTGFFIQTIRLTEIIDHVLKDLYSGPPLGQNLDQEVDSLGLSETQHRILGSTTSLDSRLLSWWNGVPKNIRQEPDIPDGIDFQRQRNVIYIRYLYTRAR